MASSAGGLGEIARLGELNGDAPEVTALAQMKAESGVHRSVIEKMADAIDSDGIGAAVAYHDANATRMTDADNSAVRRMLADPLRERQANADAAGILAGLPSPDAPTPGAGVTAGGATKDKVFGALLMQESGNRAGAVGQPTEWGRAYGAGQVLDSTARGMAKKLGMAWKPELMRATSKEGHAYQVKIARAYFDEAVEKSGGDLRRALMYYHGGPDTKKWGPKTRAYVDNVMARVGGGSASVPTAEAKRWNVEDLYARADRVAAENGWSPERLERAKKQVDQTVRRDEMLIARREQDAERAAWDTIDRLPENRLTSMSQLPAQVRANLSPEQRIRFEGDIERNTRPAPVEANGADALDLDDLLIEDPAAFANLDLRKYQARLTPGEFTRLRRQQAQIKNKPEEEIPHSRVWGIINRYAPDIGVDTGARRKGESDKDFAARRADASRLFTVVRNVANAITEGKRAPTDDEIKRAFDNAVLPVSQGGKAVPRYRPGNLPTNSIVVPNDQRRAIGDSLRRAGVPVTEATIVDAYLRNIRSR